MNEEQKTLWNGASGSVWVETRELIDRVFEPLERLLVEPIPVGSAYRVLDVGCGTGGTTVAAARRLGTGGEALGVDISAPMIDAARARAEQAGSAATFVCADAQHHAFAAASFDLRKGLGHARSKRDDQVRAGDDVWREQKMRHRQRHAAALTELRQRLVDDTARRAARRDEDVAHRRPGGEIHALPQQRVPLSHEAHEALAVEWARTDADGELVAARRVHHHVCIAASELRFERCVDRAEPEIDVRRLTAETLEELRREDEGAVVRGGEAKAAGSRRGNERFFSAEAAIECTHHLAHRLRQLLGARRRSEAARGADEERIVEEAPEPAERVTRR